MKTENRRNEGRKMYKSLESMQIHKFVVFVYKED